MSVVGFHDVFKHEIEAINARRCAQTPKRPLADIEPEKDTDGANIVDPDGNPILRPTMDSNLIGLALSGGGVRSAAFCLGALQALDAFKLIPKIDYLSTVSGGGYVGTSMTAAMCKSKDHKFPFRSMLVPEEPPGLRHIRDHSNYLFPRGVINLANNLAIFFRGLVSNALQLLPYLLAAAMITIYFNPTQLSFVALPRIHPFGVSSLGMTVTAAIVLITWLAFWSIYRSCFAQGSDV